MIACGGHGSSCDAGLTVCQKAPAHARQFMPFGGSRG